MLHSYATNAVYDHVYDYEAAIMKHVITLLCTIFCRWVKTVDSMSSLMRIGIATAGSSNSAVINAMLPPGATGLSAAVGRHLTARTFRKIGNKYTDVDSTVEKDQVGDGVSRFVVACHTIPYNLCP